MTHRPQARGTALPAAAAAGSQSTVNLWGTPLDPDTGLPAYPVHTASTASKLRKRAEDARKARLALQDRLDAVTEQFETAYERVDAMTATRARIAAAAKNHTP